MGWLRAGAFKKRLKEYQARTGKTQAQVAKDLGTTYGTLRFWLSGTRPPRVENLQAAVILFGNGCSLSEFIDDPGKEIAGVDVTQLSEKRRFLAGLMFEGITAEGLSDEDAQLLYEDWLANLNRLRALKARMRPQDGTS